MEPNKELLEAFGKCLEEVKNPPKNKTANIGSFKYSYADLIDVMDEIKKVTSKHKVYVYQPIIHKDGISYLATYLTHKGHMYEAGMIALNPNSNPQKLGAEITYLRRYSLTSLFGMVGDDDIDGNTESEKDYKSKGRDSISVERAPVRGAESYPGSHKPGNVSPTSSVAHRPLSEAQLRRMFAIGKAQGYSPEQLKEIMQNMTQKTSTQDLTRQEYDVVCNYLEKHSMLDHLESTVKEAFFNPDSEPLGF